ncbi:fumarylacetoacetate hydrolase family protein [Rhodohalobacter mucosus]|uniref:Isomerase/hydrolase n=1 Tax=Rhodohalobacter mucosus TaxID=2079485 RepID=A0A316TQW0_9BACT|nr:fumarylacetoacetate hydrolase family protein [Rhodohalobacter mucosus]PWN06997.1 isomerase/hydrolase [Rhodohalobacter mucosus]
MSFDIPGFHGMQYGTLYCIGRNYAKHAAEMNSDIPETPVVFLKPRSSIIHEGETVRIPKQSGEVHHEVELVLLIGKQVSNIHKDDALSAIAGFGVGLDITARDVQSEAKKKGLPWSLAKGFNTFAPLGNLVPYDTAKHNLGNMEIRVEVNGDVRQSGRTSDMIFRAEELISYLSGCFTLYPGDLIFTGTPEGVSPVIGGDTVSAEIENGLSTLTVHVSD